MLVIASDPGQSVTAGHARSHAAIPAAGVRLADDNGMQQRVPCITHFCCGLALLQEQVPRVRGLLWAPIARGEAPRAASEAVAQPVEICAVPLRAHCVLFWVLLIQGFGERTAAPA